MNKLFSTSLIESSVVWARKIGGVVAGIVIAAAAASLSFAFRYPE